LEARVSVEVDAEAPFGFKREEAPRVPVVSFKPNQVALDQPL